MDLRSWLHPPYQRRAAASNTQRRLLRCRRHRPRRVSQIMFLIVSTPLWLALLIWGIMALARAGAPKTPPMIHRIVTAPDGRVVTFLVPADEPASVTIAKMYPPGHQIEGSAVSPPANVVPRPIAPDKVPDLEGPKATKPRDPAPTITPSRPLVRSSRERTISIDGRRSAQFVGSPISPQQRALVPASDQWRPPKVSPRRHHRKAWSAVVCLVVVAGSVWAITTFTTPTPSPEPTRWPRSETIPLIHVSWSEKN
jgi:hypothetical protein